MEVQGVKCLTQGHTASAFGALPLSVHGSSWVFPSWRQELASPPPRWAPSCVRTLRGHILGIVPGQLMPDLPQGEPLCIFSPPPLSLESLEESRALSPRGDVELSKAARSPRGDPEAPINCSSCPGPPAVAPQRPALQLLQLLLRMNLSNTQTLPVSPSGAQASPSPSSRPRGPGASQPPQPSSGPLIPPGASSLPPASPRAPGPPPLTPALPSSASGAHSASRRPSLPAAVPRGASALSTTGPGASETPVTVLRPRRSSPATSRLSAALVATASPSPRQPTLGTSQEEESTV